MAGKSNYLEGQFLTHELRTGTFTKPSGIWVGLFATTKGERANSTAYALNDTIFTIANDTVIHLYKCTTAGTSAASQNTLYPGVKGEVITDGGAVFTEQGNVADAGSSFVELSGGSYARVQNGPSDAAWSAPSGTPRQVSNVGSVTFPAPTAPWLRAAFFGTFDASSGGNLLRWAPLSAAKNFNTGDPAPYFPAGSLIISED